MRRLNLQDLKRYTAITYEGASAYDYSQSHPLIHLTFTFGAALFVDGFYEKEQEQVRRFARALVEASRVEPKFPWQYGVWMRDPKEGKGNRIQGSLVPALLDALLDRSEYNETYVARSLRYRPDDVLAFLAHFRDLGLGEPSPAARSGMARALTHFDEYQLLKYARANADIRLCDAIYLVQHELRALGAEGALALSVGRYLHAPTRARGQILSDAASGRDGMVPLPLAAARRRLFQLKKEDVFHPSFPGLVAESRVTWEQVIGQFGRSVKLPGQARRALRRLASWDPPKPYVPALWRLAYLPRMLLSEQIALLEAALKEKDTPQAAHARRFLAKISREKKPWTLKKLGEVVAHNRAKKEGETLTPLLAELVSEIAREHGPEEARPYRTIYEAQLLHEALNQELFALRKALAPLCQGNPDDAAFSGLRDALRAISAKLEETAGEHSAFAEARALVKECLALAQAEEKALRKLLRAHVARSMALFSLRNQAALLLRQESPITNLDKLRALDRATHTFVASAPAESPWRHLPEGASPALTATAARFARRYEKAQRVVERVAGVLSATLPKIDTPDIRAHNRAVWGALLEAPGLFPDMAFLRNIRNLHTSGVSMDALVASAKKRAFHGVWPHQIYAGYKAEPDLAPVFEEILQKMLSLLPKGRHLGIGDASGSMCVQVGGAKGSVTCLEVALLFTAMMSQTSDLGASFSDGTWGKSSYLSLARRRKGEGVLAFSRKPELQAGMGGTQVFGAVLELIAWLKRNDSVTPPDCLWFFSDMQFHPAEGAVDTLPAPLLKEARALGLGQGRPPLELALDLYRKHFGPVDVVLWNLAAYAPIPVPSDMKGVLLVSGFDANTFRYVETWRQGGDLPTEEGTVEESQEVILEAIRRY